MKFAGSLDANIVLRLLVGDVPSQLQAAQNLINGANAQLAVADITVIEVEYALRQHYLLTRTQIQSLLSKFLAHPKINANKVLFNRAMLSYVDAPKLSLADCCLTEYAELNEALPLWTFDKKWASQGGDRVRLLVL